MPQQSPPSRPGVGVSDNAQALLRRVVVNPVFAAGGQHQLAGALGFDMQGVQAGRRRCGTESDYIIVGYIVRQRDQAVLQTLGIVEVMELAPGKLRHGFRGVGAQCVARGKKSHGGQSKRRSQLADAVEHLLVVVAVVLGIGPLSTKAALRRTGFAVI